MALSSNHIHELLHRRILNPPEGLTVDHINGDKLDNTRHNLRLATHIQNTQNSIGRPSRRFSKFKGVQYRSVCPDKPWKARIFDGQTNSYIGSYPSEELAALAYDSASRHYHKEFAKLNFPNVNTPALSAEQLRAKHKIDYPSLRHSTRYMGIRFRPDQNKWIAEITLNGTKRHITNSRTELESAIAYACCHLYYFKELPVLSILGANIIPLSIEKIRAIKREQTSDEK